jgi:hypothetical protein
MPNQTRRITPDGTIGPIIDLSTPEHEALNSSLAVGSDGSVISVWVQYCGWPDDEPWRPGGNVIYSWTGLKAPINSDGSSVSKQGSTVPVKFQLGGPSVAIGNIVATLSYAGVSDNVAGAENEADSTSAATSGNLFRYDSRDNHYIFNWSTKRP